MTKKPNEWNSDKEEFRNKYPNQNYPILTNYLNYTFLRVQEQDKIIYSKEKDKVCFNTGLQTKRGKDIFATFFKNNQASIGTKTRYNYYRGKTVLIMDMAYIDTRLITKPDDDWLTP